MASALAFVLSPAAAFADGSVRLGYDDKATIVATGQPVYPEGIAYDPAGRRFFVGSARFGHLFTVSETGKLRQFSSDERIATTLGIKVDPARNRVVAAVTDYAHAIYKIDAAGAKSVLVHDERFKGEGFALNGLDVYPDGYLLVVKKSDGEVLKVPLDDSGKFSEVRLPESLVAADDVLLVGGDLAVIRNLTSSVAANAQAALVAANEVVVLRSSDGWLSATIADRKSHEDNYPSTATRYGNQIVLVASHLNALASVLKDNPGMLQQQFQIHTIGTSPVRAAHRDRPTR